MMKLNKYIAISILAGATLVGAGALTMGSLVPQAAAQTRTAQEAANVKVVEALYAALQSPTPSADQVMALLTDDAYVRWSDKDKPAQGKTEVAAKVAGLFKDPNTRYRVVVHNTYAVGRMVVAPRDDISVQNGQAGKPFEIIGVFIVRDGKIASWIDYERN